MQASSGRGSHLLTANSRIGKETGCHVEREELVLEANEHGGFAGRDRIAVKGTVFDEVGVAREPIEVDLSMPVPPSTKSLPLSFSRLKSKMS
jgi:hypothetical protein